eukprot:Colp12_sorted_trinity150504_noHs@9157
MRPQDHFEAMRSAFDDGEESMDDTTPKKQHKKRKKAKSSSNPTVAESTNTNTVSSDEELPVPQPKRTYVPADVLLNTCPQSEVDESWKAWVNCHPDVVAHYKCKDASATHLEEYEKLWMQIYTNYGRDHNNNQDAIRKRRQWYRHLYVFFKAYGVPVLPGDPYDPTVLVHFMEYHFKKDELPVTFQGFSEKLKGRGLATSSFNKFDAFINKLYGEWKIAGKIPEIEFDLGSTIKKWKGDTYKGHTYVKGIRKSIKKNLSEQPTKQATQLRLFGDFVNIFRFCCKLFGQAGLVIWVQILLAFALFLRRSEVCGLYVNDVRVPITMKNGKRVPMLDPNGVPPHMFVRLRYTKTNKSKIGTPMVLWKNPKRHRLSWIFCPVHWLWFYLCLNIDLIRSAAKGNLVPLFPSLLDFVPSGARIFSALDWFVSTLTPESETNVAKRMDAAFEAAGCRPTTLDTFRRTAVAWASISGAAVHKIIAAGRWANEQYLTYMGCLELVMALYGDD